MTSRANGEGSITRRSDGRWQVMWFEQGVRKYGYVRGTRADAKRKLREIVDRLADGFAGMDARTPLGEWLSHWLAEILPTARGRNGMQLSPKSIETYASAIRANILGDSPAPIARVPLGQLTPLHGEQLEARIATAHTASYAHSTHKALKRALNDACKARLIARNPLDDVVPPRGKPKPKPTPKAEHVRQLMEQAPTPRLRAFVGVLGFTGLRISEALDLQWTDVDWEARTMLVHGKGSKDREVTLAPTLLAELRTWQAAQRRQRMAATWWGDGDWLLSSEVGTRWDVYNARKQFRPLAAAVLPGITPHSLRHATATLLLKEGVPMKVVSELLGHSSMRVTSDIYSHVDVELLATATDALDRALGEG